METITKTKTVKTMKTINATNGDFVNLINGLYQVQDIKGKDFSISVSKNIAILRDKLKDLEKAGTPSEEFMQLATKVNELANAGEENAKEEIDKLEEENKELVESRRIQMEEVTEMMKEKIKVKLNILTEDSLPEDITAKQINSLIKIIE
tara:strand:- start:936 stop:1385 length:450 start_codon:yes stop_codon:yes gene_type:complete